MAKRSLETTQVEEGEQKAKKRLKPEPSTAAPSTSSSDCGSVVSACRAGSVRTWCPATFRIPKGTVFYKGFRAATTTETKTTAAAAAATTTAGRRQPVTGYYTIDVPRCVSELSGERKAQLFGEISYFVNVGDLQLLELTDSCFPTVRQAFYDCTRAPAFHCFPAFMCSVMDGWVNREDLGPLGGFEVYICKPELLQSITAQQAVAMREEQCQRRAASAVEQLKKQLQEQEARGEVPGLLVEEEGEQPQQYGLSSTSQLGIIVI